MNKKDKKNFNRVRAALREVRNKCGDREPQEQSYLKEYTEGKGIYVINWPSVFNELHERGFVERCGSDNKYILTKKL